MNIVIHNIFVYRWNQSKTAEFHSFFYLILLYTQYFYYYCAASIFTNWQSFIQNHKCNSNEIWYDYWMSASTIVSFNIVFASHLSTAANRLRRYDLNGRDPLNKLSWNCINHLLEYLSSYSAEYEKLFVPPSFPKAYEIPKNSMFSMFPVFACHFWCQFNGWHFA